MSTYIIFNILWETNGEKIDCLPEAVKIDIDPNEELGKALENAVDDIADNWGYEIKNYFYCQPGWNSDWKEHPIVTINGLPVDPSTLD